MKKTIFSTIFLSALVVVASCAQRTEDRFNLGFQFADSSDFAWRSVSVQKPRIDSSECVRSKYPIYFEATKVYAKMPDEVSVWHLKVGLYQQFVMSSPSGESKELEISIHNKCIGLDSLMLRVSGFDCNGTLINVDSLNINNSSRWEQRSLKTPLDNAVSFSVSLSGEGNLLPWSEEKRVPRLYLDSITISINGKDIHQIKGINQPTSPTLKKEYIYPISSHDTNILRDIKLNKKKIIALGETIHGSKTINETAFQMARSSILHNNCKLVLLETDLASSLKYNLFVQGKFEDEEIHEIREAEHDLHMDMSSFVSFLKWVREYNKTADKKVKILGTLDAHQFIKSPLYDYIQTFYQEKEKDILLPLMKDLHKQKMADAFQQTTEHEETLKLIMGEDEYSLFSHTLGNLAAVEMKKKPRTSVGNYDYSMWMNVDALITMYTQVEETALIYAHYGHVQKTVGQLENPMDSVLGNYLYKRYKDDYSVIGMTVGAGSFTTREQTSQKHIASELEKPAEGSYEKVCMKQQDPCFYYPSAQLAYPVCLIRHIGNKESLFTGNYHPNFLKANSDGFIFMRMSESFQDDYPYDKEYLWNKAVRRAAYLKELSQ